MKRALFALGLVALLAVSALAGETFLGFELLDLDGAYVKWGGEPNGGSVVVTYAVVKAPASFTNARNCDGLAPLEPLLERSNIASDEFKRELRAAFDMWQRVANIEFKEVDDTSSAGILIGAQAHPVGRAFTNVDYKPGDEEHTRYIVRSLICLNPDKLWKIGFDGNLDVYDLRYTIAHEIGHAIGLDHPSSSGELMSFRYEERFRHLQAGDVSGATKIYGPRQ